MKILKLFVSIICISFILSGCASIPEPSDEYQTLVVGIVTYQGKNYPSNYSGLNGNKAMGLEITIMEINNGKSYTMQTQANGFFFSYDIPEGIYRITRCYVKGPKGAFTWFTPVFSMDNRLEIVDGKVNNLGVRRWESDFVGENRNTSNEITFHREHERVRDLFQRKNKSSGWNQREWVDLGL